jgi:tetratricopeptide (TPR) repeat protein
VALTFAKELFTFADRRRDPALLIVAHDALGDTSLWTGELRAARRHLERGVELYNREGQGSDATLFGYDSGVACLSFLALTLWYLGYPDEASRRGEEAMTLARELGTPAGMAQTMFFTAWVHQLRGDTETARTRTDDLITLCEEQGIPMYLAAGRLLRGLLLAEEGKAEEGVALMREGIAGHRATGTELGASVWSGAWLAEGLLEAGGVDEALQVITDALAFVERTGERFHEADLWRLRAEALRQSGAGEAQAEAMLERALAAARHCNAKSLELRAEGALAQLRSM